MARYRKDYEGEQRTQSLRVQLTASERETLERGAQEAGTSLSQHTRELCLRRSAAVQIVAGARRNPEARALMNELTAIGVNLNQIAKVANTHRATPQLDELRETTTLLKAAFSRILAL